jgi:hypothetical protein
LRIGGDPWFPVYGNLVIDEISISDTPTSTEFNKNTTLWMPFDESSEANIDISDFGNDGSLQGATFTTDGKYAGGIQFDGIDDYVNVPDSSSLDITNEITVEAWVKPLSSSSGYKPIVNKTLSYMLRLYNMKPSFSILVDGSWHTIFADNAISTDAWYHIAGTYSSTTKELKIYVNGVEKSITLSGLSTYSITPSDISLRIGGDPWFAAYNNAVIDDVRISTNRSNLLEVKLD